MEFVIAGGILFLVYSWYQNTVVKPIEEAKQFIEHNIIEPIKEGAENAFEATSEAVEKTGALAENLSQINESVKQDQDKAVYGGILVAGKHIKPITSEVRHGFQDFEEKTREEASKVKPTAQKGVEAIQQGDLIQGAKDLSYSGQAVGAKGVEAIGKGAENVGKEIGKAGKAVGGELEKGAKATQKGAQRAGQSIANFFGF